MKPIQSPVKQFVKRLLLTISALLAANVLLFGVYIYSYKKSASKEMLPIPLLKELSGALTSNGSHFELDSATAGQLQSQHLWAMLLDNRQGHVLWSFDLPKELSRSYTLSDIAFLSRYYLEDYPVFTWKHPHGLIILGFPKDSFSRITGVLSHSEIGIMRGWMTLIPIGNLLILLLIYFIINRKTLKTVAGILSGIQSLANGKLIQLEEKGTFSEIAAQLNRTSDLLKVRSTAQENWIAGVSHDIRTPLSVILGYAEQIEKNTLLSKEVREKASGMKFQSIRLRNLVNDLNLATRLGNGNILIQHERFHPAGFCRTLIAGFLNDASNENYSVEFDLDKETETVYLSGDRHLLQRAVNNLLYNSIRHNPNGCIIYFSLQQTDNRIMFTLSDNGKGLEAGQLEKLQNRPHYLSGSNSTLMQQHGLGLYIVQQIVRLHNGCTSFGNRAGGGFQTTIFLPVSR